MTKPDMPAISDASSGDGSAGAHAGKPYDLEERTARFGEAIIAFSKTIPHSPVTRAAHQPVGPVGDERRGKLLRSG